MAPVWGVADCLWEDCKAEGELQGAAGCQQGPHTLGLCHFSLGAAAVAPNPQELGNTAGHLHSPRSAPGDLSRGALPLVQRPGFPSLLWLEELCDAQKPGGALGRSEGAEGKLGVQ